MRTPLSLQCCLPITEPSQAAEARRVATHIAHRLGLTEAESGQVALVVSEAATNLAKHAREGQMLLRAVEGAAGPGVELLALDKGPGMADVAQCLRDGYSTAGSPGTGLGAITRLSTLSDFYSVPGEGTALLARVHTKVHTPKSIVQASPTFDPDLRPLEAGVVSLPMPGEEECGDAWVVEQQARRCLVMIADGLGHGPAAAEAAHAIVDVCRRHATRTPAEILEAAHAAARGTRGAAVGVAEIDRTKQVVRFAGVGNIAGVIWTTTGSRSMASHNGIVGHEVRRIQEFTYPWSADALVVLHSDGLQTRWRLDAYPGLTRRHPSLIAGVLYRDFTRGRDDVTIVALTVAKPLRT
jgi:anti-sigma regulatory factor (Ser/Thr protein kinase)